MKRLLLKSTLTFLAVMIVIVLGVNFSVTRDDDSPTNRIVVSLATSAYASGTADYTCTGVNDHIPFQQALNALPASGGELFVYGGVYNFGATVTRALANVIIIGVGRGTYITFNGVNPVFTAGGNNWKIENIRTDAGGIDMGATTGWAWSYVDDGTNLYDYRNPTNSIIAGVATFGSVDAPTGRASTYIVAANDSPTHLKEQADYVCDGTADEEEVQNAVDALPAIGGVVELATGTFNFRNSVYIESADDIVVRGNGAIVTQSHFVETVLTSDVTLGDTTIDVTSSAGLSIGDGVWIGDSSYVAGESILATITNIIGNQLTVDYVLGGNVQILATVRDARLATLFPYFCVAVDNIVIDDIVLEGIIFDGNDAVVIPTRAGILTFMVYVDTTNDPTIQNNIFRNSKRPGLIITSNRPKINDNVWFDFVTTEYQPVHFGGDSGVYTGFLFTRNRFYNCSATNGTAGANVYLCLEVWGGDITHCVFDTFGMFGIESEGGAGANTNRNINIDSCQFYNPTIAGGCSVLLHGVNSDFTIQNNTLDHSTLVTTQGIYNVGTANRIIVRNNTLIECMVDLYGTVTGADITDNTVYLTAPEQFIRPRGAQKVKVSGNTVYVPKYLILFRDTNSNFEISDNSVFLSNPQSYWLGYYNAAAELATTYVEIFDNNLIGIGEMRQVTFDIVGGVQNTVSSVQNTLGRDILILEAIVFLSDESVGAPTFDMGTDDDGAGAPSVGNNLFDAIPDTAGYYRATSNGLGGGASGVLTQPILWQSVGNDWVNFIITDADGASADGQIYITVIGK